MKAKALETLLASETGLPDMVTRFQGLRKFSLISKRRGRNAEYLQPDEIVLGVLSVVSSRPNYAAARANELSHLKSVSAADKSFAGEAGLWDAMEAVITKPTVRETLEKVILGDSPAPQISAEIFYKAGNEIKSTVYVHDTVLTRSRIGGFDRHSTGNSSIFNEKVLLPRLFERVSQKLKEAMDDPVQRKEIENMRTDL